LAPSDASTSAGRSDDSSHNANNDNNAGGTRLGGNEDGNSDAISDPTGDVANANSANHSTNHSMNGSASGLQKKAHNAELSSMEPQLSPSHVRLTKRVTEENDEMIAVQIDETNLNNDSNEGPGNNPEEDDTGNGGSNTNPATSNSMTNPVTSIPTYDQTAYGRTNSADYRVSKQSAVPANQPAVDNSHHPSAGPSGDPRQTTCFNPNNPAFPARFYSQNQDLNLNIQQFLGKKKTKACMAMSHRDQMHSLVKCLLQLERAVESGSGTSYNVKCSRFGGGMSVVPGSMASMGPAPKPSVTFSPGLAGGSFNAGLSPSQSTSDSHSASMKTTFSQYLLTGMADYEKLLVRLTNSESPRSVVLFSR
jgi:hypothetical protein